MSEVATGRADQRHSPTPGVEFRPAPHWWYALAIIAISALSALQIPYRYGNGNQVFQLPSVHRAMQPELYPGDALVESLENYPSVVYPALAWVAGTLGVGVEPLYLATWLIERVVLVGLFMVIAARFVEGFGGRVFVTLVACTSHWAIMRTLVGGEHIFAAHLTHTNLAFVLQLAALAAWLHLRPVTAAVALGLAAYLNVMTTLHFAGFMLLLLVLSGKWRTRDARVAVLTGAVIAVPFAVRVAQLSLGETGAAGHSDLFWKLQFALPNHHFLMDVWDVPALISLSVVIGLAAFAGRLEAPLRHIAAAGAVYLGVMFVTSLFGAHLFPSKLVLMLHPLRGDKPLHLALVIVVPVFIWHRVTAADLPKPARVLLPALAAVFMLGVRPPSAILPALPLLLATHLLLSGGDPSHRRVRATVLALVGLLAAAAILLAIPGARTMSLALLLGIAASCAALYRRQWAAVTVAVVVIVSAGQVARSTLGRSEDGSVWYRGATHWDFDDVCDWADAHTPPSARFITPPWIEGWRCLSRRSTLVQYRDGSAMDWYPRFELGWWERLDAIDCQLMPNHPDLHDELRRRYLDLTPRDILRAARAHEIDYVVMPVQWSHGDEVEAAYSNESYQVFTISALNRVFDEADDADEMEADRDGR